MDLGLGLWVQCRPSTGKQYPLPCFPSYHLPQLFNDAIRLAVSYKQNSRDFMDEVLQELEVGQAQMSDGIEKTASRQRGVEYNPVEWLLPAFAGCTWSLCAPPLGVSGSWANSGPGLTCNLVHRTLTWSRRRRTCRSKSSVAVSRAHLLPESEKEASLQGQLVG